MFSTMASYYNDIHPAMASSANPTRPRASSYSVTIALSNNRADDRRVFKILPGQNVVMGRSSRSEFKNLQPADDNALFDCPVVSRLHAELRASPWEPTANQVTITDRSSLHGTTVNGKRLAPGCNLPLQSGDVIKLGERVTRGDDTHDGVSLTFQRLDDLSSQRYESAAPKSRAFQVPVESDASDLDDDIDYNYGSHHSSAKTTPEQPKVKQGSQESPINLDADVRLPSRVIDLVDEEDDDIMVMSAVPPCANNPVKRRIIPNTYEEDEAPVLVPESVLDKEHSLFVEDALEVTTNYGSDDDDESVRLHNTGLSQILNERDDFSEDGDEERAMESDLDDEVEYDANENHIEEADSLYDSGASDVSDVESPDSYFDDEPSNWSANRAPSEELGVVEEQQKPAETATINFPGFSTASSNNAPKPRYDPVRSSQPPAEDEPRSSTTAHAPVKTTSTYTYGSFGIAQPFVNPATDMSTSSRWDVPSSAPAFPYDDIYMDHYGPKPNSSFFAPFGFDNFSQPMAIPHQHQAQTHPQMQMPVNTAATLPNAAPDWPLHQPIPNSFEAPAPFRPDVVAPAPPANTLVTKGKISITDIVDEPKEMMENAREMVAEAHSAAQDVPPISAAKRNADQMDAEETVEAPTPKKSKQTPATLRQPKNRRSMARRVAAGTAQIAGGALVGMTATVAFLSSDYAGQLLQWLNTTA